MSDVVLLFPSVPPRGPLPDYRVVGLLRDLLAEAEAGRIRTCAVATLCPQTDEPGLRPVLYWVDEPDHYLALSGAVGKMAHDIAEGPL